jgi:hypothetical protein
LFSFGIFFEFNKLETYHLTDEVCVKCKSDWTLNHTNEICHSSIEFCQIYEEVNDANDEINCSECQSSYFLETNKICKPLSQITNCLEYSKSSDKCLKCSTNYFLSDNNCLLLPKIEFCENFELVDDKFVCSSCSEMTYLSLSDNQCHQRKYSLEMIPNCENLNPNFDQCETCKTEFLLSSDSLSCLQTVQHCLDNSLVLNSSRVYQCNQCEPNYQLNEEKTLCYSLIENCQKYNSEFDQCALCTNNSHFLEADGSCKPRTNTSPYCQDYSTTQDTCSTCQESFQLTSDSLNCLPEISFCLVIFFFIN